MRPLAYFGLLALACQLPAERPPVAAEPRSAPAASEPASLPPEETPPEESPAPAPTAAAQPIEPGIAATGAPTRGKLPKGVLEERLQAAGAAFSGCYERALKVAPNLRGNLSINFVVDEGGKVAHAEAMEVADPLEDAATVDCILGEIRKLTFPPPRGGRVFVNYPLKLEPPAPTPPSR